MKFKSTILILLFFGFFSGLFRFDGFSKKSLGDTIQIAQNHYRIDHKNKLILVNQKIEEFYPAPTQKVASILLDTFFHFLEPQASLKTGLNFLVHLDTSVFSLYFISLPFVDISTEDTIPMNSKVNGFFNFLDQNNVEISNQISIGVHGGYSRTFPKKSYNLDFWQGYPSNGIDVSFPGLRSDDDWVLISMYNEKLRFMNHFSNELWLKIHKLHYQQQEPEAIGGVRTKYAELFLNGEYTGLYLIAEKIDRKQLKLKKYDGSVRGELYKGAEWTGATVFCDSHKFYNQLRYDGGFEYKYPSEEETTNWSNLEQLVRFAAKSDSVTFYANVWQNFDPTNMVDYFIFVNLLRIVDNLGKNIFVCRYKANQPYFFTPWDLDGVLGFGWSGGLDPLYSDLLVNGLHIRLLKDHQPNGFLDRLKSRWKELKSGPLNIDSLEKTLNKQYEFLKSEGVYERENKLWPNTVGDSTRFSYVKDWLQNRHAFLSEQFIDSENEITKNLIVYCTDDIPTIIDTTISNPVDTIPIFPDSLNKSTPVQVVLYPNPVEKMVEIGFPGDIQTLDFVIRDILGKKVLTGIVSKKESKIDVSSLLPGTYFFLCGEEVRRFIIVHF